MSHNFPASSLREGVMAHNHPPLVCHLDTNGTLDLLDGLTLILLSRGL